MVVARTVLVQSKPTTMPSESERRHHRSDSERSSRDRNRRKKKKKSRSRREGRSSSVSSHTHDEDNGADSSPFESAADYAAARSDEEMNNDRDARYHHVSTHSHDEESSYDDPRDNQESLYYDEESARYAEGATLGQDDDDMYYDQQHEDPLMTSADEENYIFPDDDDSMDDPNAHPLENPNLPRRPPAMTPGAVAVVRRGYEEQDLEGEDEWDPTAPAPQEEAPPQFPLRRPARQYIDAAVVPIKKNLDDMSTTRLVIYCIILVAILGGAGAGIAVAVSGGEQAPPPPIYTDICDFTGNPQPNPIIECSCNGNMTTMWSEDVLSRYDELKFTFIPSIIPEGVDSDIDSCDPQNVALLWLATDTQERTPESMRNRYLLSLLYAYWMGIRWTHKDGWLSPDSECTWMGVNCTDTQITKLDLFENDMVGDLVTELGLLQDLRKCTFYVCQTLSLASTVIILTQRCTL